MTVAILDLLPDGFKKTGSDEWHGPCPSCGGDDRCVVTPSRNLYWCRQCDQGGDPIKYLREHRGMSFQDAAEHVGKPLDEWTDTKAAIAGLRRRESERRKQAVRDGLLQTLRAKQAATEAEWDFIMLMGECTRDTWQRSLAVTDIYERDILNRDN